MGLFSSFFSSAAQPEQNPYLDYEELLRANPNLPMIEAAGAEAPIIPAEFTYPQDVPYEAYLGTEGADAEAPLVPSDFQYPRTRRTKREMGIMRDAEAPIDPEFAREAADAEARLVPRAPRRPKNLIRETVDAEAPLVTRWKNIDRLYEKALQKKARRQ